jgi:hypothetical protein
VGFAKSRVGCSDKFSQKPTGCHRNIWEIFGNKSRASIVARRNPQRFLRVTGVRRTPKKRSSRNGADAAEPNDQTRDRVLGPQGVIRKSLGFCKTDYDSKKLFDQAETVGLSHHPALRPRRRTCWWQFARSELGVRAERQPETENHKGVAQCRATRSVGIAAIRAPVTELIRTPYTCPASTVAGRLV